MYEEKPSELPTVNCIWHAIVTAEGTYTDPANEHWGVAFTRRTDGSEAAELIGPTLMPRILSGHVGDEYWGVEFKSYVAMHGVNKQMVLGTAMLLPTTDGQFFIGNYAYAIRQYDELEEMVEQLMKDGVIVADDRVRRSLQGGDAGLSERSRQRYFKEVTGLTKKQITQLERARHAYFLLQTGMNIVEAAAEAGYADQAHMTRSLQLIRSETPAQIIEQHMRRTRKIGGFIQ